MSNKLGEITIVVSELFCLWTGSNHLFMATIFILEMNLETENCVVVLNMPLIMYNIQSI